MSVTKQFRGGTTVQHATFTGADREITVDTDTKTLVVHDGTTVGGHRVSLEGDLSTHTALINNPHAVTQAQVGLSNVDNTSDANKPVSTLQQAAIDVNGADVIALKLLTGTTSEERYDKINASLDIIYLDKTSGKLDYVQYAGDDDATIYYRDVMIRDGATDLIRVDHFYGTANLVTASGQTLMPRTAGEIDSVTYIDV